MERRKITMYNIWVGLLIIVLIATIAVSIVAVIKDKSKDTESETVIAESTETIQMDTTEDYEKPDLTLEEYNSKIYEIEADNANRYDIDSMNKIIQRDVKAPTEEVVLELKDYDSTTIDLFNKAWFNDIKAIYYPYDATIIMIYNLKLEYDAELENELDTFIDSKQRALDNDTYKAIYKYYNKSAYNNYTVLAICDNSEVIVNDIISYMENQDKKAVYKFTSKYELTEHGAYKKDNTDEEESTGQLESTETIYSNIEESKEANTEANTENIEENSEQTLNIDGIQSDISTDDINTIKETLTDDQLQLVEEYKTTGKIPDGIDIPEKYLTEERQQ